MNAKLNGKTSCRNCQFLIAKDSGYSNYTVMDTELVCVLNANPHLPLSGVDAFDYFKDECRGIKDRLPQTCNSLCLRFIPRGTELEHFNLDVDMEVDIADATRGFAQEAIDAITKYVREQQ